MTLILTLKDCTDTEKVSDLPRRLNTTGAPPGYQPPKAEIFNGSLFGGIPETQELMNWCAERKIYPQVQIITAEDVNDAREKIVNKEAGYR